MVRYLLAVDGGGTGTRVAIASADGEILTRGEAGPSALGQGVAQAWMQVQRALVQGFARMGISAPPWSECALAAGLSGVHNESFRARFLEQLPAFAEVIAVSDGYTMLLGAHAGQPGIVVASGTGSVGEVLRADGSHQVAGGWGFPVGDEGSGAWLGLQAVRVAQGAMDGRASVGALARRVWQHCGGTRREMGDWVAQAGQFGYAQVAPLVFETQALDAAADHMLAHAAQELVAIVQALDPALQLPVAVCGSIGTRLQSRMADALPSRLVEPAMGPEEGALLLLLQTRGARQ